MDWNARDRWTDICEWRREINFDQGNEVPQKLRFEFEAPGIEPGTS
jgi:hypothetical protein